MVGAFFGSEPAKVQHVPLRARRGRVLADVDAVMDHRRATEGDFELELTPTDGHEVNLGMGGVHAREFFFAVMVQCVDDGNAEIGRASRREIALSLFDITFIKEKLYNI